MRKTGRAARKRGFKEQFAAMAFSQLAARRFMRDGLRCMAAAENRLCRWGLKNVARSTFYAWMVQYNMEKTHQGIMRCGRTPMQVLLDGKSVWEEKVGQINS